MDLKDVQPYIEDKVCMVTGGGGSIGSEIVRSLSKLNAEKNRNCRYIRKRCVQCKM